MYEDIEKFIRCVPDFPKKGILFRDITPALQNPQCYAQIIAAFADVLKGKKIDKIAAIESRGYLFGAPLAQKLGCGLVLLRKPGKLPARTLKEEYDLEYGSAALEVHEDAISVGENVLIIDDLLATGGTAVAACKLVQRLKGNISGVAFLIELEGLNGASKISAYAPVVSLLKY